MYCRYREDLAVHMPQEPKINTSNFVERFPPLILAAVKRSSIRSKWAIFNMLNSPALDPYLRTYIHLAVQPFANLKTLDKCGQLPLSALKVS